MKGIFCGWISFSQQTLKCVLMAQEQGLVIFSLMFAGFGLSHTNYMDSQGMSGTSARPTCNLLFEFGYQIHVQCVTMVLH